MRSRGRAGRAVGAACLALVSWAGAPQSGAAQSGDALEVLEGAAQRYAAVSTLCARFTQEISVPLLGEERTGRGRLCQARPDRFAMRFDEPEGDLVVVDGTWVWLYYPSVDPRQVVRFRLSEAPGGFDLHREFLERPAEKYEATLEGREAVGGFSTLRIRLRPRRPTTYRAAVVWIDADEDVLRRVRVEEENGSVRTVTLDDVRLDVPPPEGWFAFTPPPGAQVISR